MWIWAFITDAETFIWPHIFDWVKKSEQHVIRIPKDDRKSIWIFEASIHLRQTQWYESGTAVLEVVSWIFRIHRLRSYKKICKICIKIAKIAIAKLQNCNCIYQLCMLRNCFDFRKPSQRVATSDLQRIVLHFPFYLRTISINFASLVLNSKRL